MHIDQIQNLPIHLRNYLLPTREPVEAKGRKDQGNDLDRLDRPSVNKVRQGGFIENNKIFSTEIWASNKREYVRSGDRKDEDPFLSHPEIKTGQGLFTKINLVI